jgi:hypothetical protein
VLIGSNNVSDLTASLSGTGSRLVPGSFVGRSRLVPGSFVGRSSPFVGRSRLFAPVRELYAPVQVLRRPPASPQRTFAA